MKARDYEEFHLFSKCVYKNSMYFVSIRASTWSMEVKMSGIIVLNLGQSVFEKHMRNCQMSVVQRNNFTYHMEEMTGNTFSYIYIEMTSY